MSERPPLPPPSPCADSNDHLLQRQSRSSCLLTDSASCFSGRFVLLFLFTSLAFGENFNRSSQNQRHPQTRRGSQWEYQSSQPAQPWIFATLTISTIDIDICHLDHLHRGHFIISSLFDMDIYHLSFVRQGLLSPHPPSLRTSVTSSSFT